MGLSPVSQGVISFPTVGFLMVFSVNPMGLGTTGWISVERMGFQWGWLKVNGVDFVGDVTGVVNDNIYPDLLLNKF